jgi:hypothetical protein
MALLDTFRGIFEGDERAHRRVNEDLRNLYQGFVERAAHIELTAGEAPTEAMENDLRKLAADHRETAELIKVALEARKSSAPSAVAAPAPTGAVNHWARVVEDLEDAHKGHNQLREVANRILESNPELTDLFDTLTQRLAAHVARLRGEIARADPQALN